MGLNDWIGLDWIDDWIGLIGLDWIGEYREAHEQYRHHLLRCLLSLTAANVARAIERSLLRLLVCVAPTW